MLHETRQCVSPDADCGDFSSPQSKTELFNTWANLGTCLLCVQGPKKILGPEWLLYLGHLISPR